jgi:hypothetical protein
MDLNCGFILELHFVKMNYGTKEYELNKIEPNCSMCAPQNICNTWEMFYINK